MERKNIWKAKKRTKKENKWELKRGVRPAGPASSAGGNGFQRSVKTNQAAFISQHTKGGKKKKEDDAERKEKKKKEGKNAREKEQTYAHRRPFFSLVWTK